MKGMATSPVELTKEERKAIAAHGYADPVYFCKFFLSKWFPLEMPLFHRVILAILLRRCDFLDTYGEVDRIIKNFVWFDIDDVEKKNPHYIFHRDEEGVLHMTLGKFKLLLVPRGFAKTSLANAVNLMNIVYQECSFPFYTSETGSHATRQLKNVTKQLISNAKIKIIFGELRPPQRNVDNLSWSESNGFIQTTTGISMAAIGRGGQVRGQLDDGQRPDRMTIDDVEDKESVSTDEQRKKALEWFYGDLLPALPELDPNATAVMLATLLHQDALAIRVSQDPEWTTVNLGVLDVDGKPIWPAMMDEEKIERKKQRYAMQGLLAIFYLEYFNQIRNDDDAKFKADNIIVFPRVSIIEANARVLMIDPAISQNKKADFCAFTVIELIEQKIHVWEAFGKVGMTPREQVDKYFELSMKYKPQKHGIETIAYQAALVHLMQEEMFRAKHYFEIQKIESHKGKKDPRILGILSPRYANQFITHQKHFLLLNTQLLDFPNGKKDLPDCLAMGITLLDDYAPLAGTGDPTEDEYEPLDKVFGGDYRRYT